MIYEQDFKISPRQVESNKKFINAVISNYAEANNPDEKDYHGRKFNEEANMVMESKMHRDGVLSRYHSFSETVRNVLVTEALYKMYKEAVSEDVKEDIANRTVMRAIVNEYVQENGYDYILNRMKNASIAMSEMYNTIAKTTKAILENVDKSNPDTFVITPEMKDDFFKQLDYSNDEEISKAITARVSDAMNDFVTANTKDHDDITAALKHAQEKIAEVPEENVELREYYEMKGKRKVSEIRNAPKGLLHGMVSAMCESVLKHDELHREFMNEGHLDIGKISTRVSLMYTFLEMLNTARIEKVDEKYLSEIVENLSK